MQSSLGGVLRALVMLVCLIVGPLLALPNVSFPVWLKQIAKGRWGGKSQGESQSLSDNRIAQGKTAQPSSQRGGKGSSSLFGAFPAALGQSEAGWPGLQTPSQNPASTAGQPASVSPAGLVASLKANAAAQEGKPTGSVDQAVFLKVAGAAESPVAEQDPRSRAAGEGLSRSQGVIPTAFVEQSPSQASLAAAARRINDPFAQQQIPVTQAASAPAPPQPSAEQLSRFRVVEERLRSLGAVHYLLEAWGNATEYYRFRCRMPVAGSSTAVRYFEATDSDGLAAMSKVLRDIEAWKAQSM